MNKRDDFLNTLRTALAVRLAVAALPALLSLVGGPEAWATTDTTFAAPLTTVTDMVAGTGGQLDRVSRVIQSPGGFTVEHDSVRGDLYLYPDRAALRAADPFGAPDGSRAPAPVTLYLGTELGFTYRLSLSAVSRDSAQILIRNAAVTASSVGRTRPVAGEHRDEAVSLILAVARREPVAGYIILPTAVSMTSPERGSLVELWRGPRFTARVLRTPAGGVEDAQQLARRSGANVVAAWLSAPGRGPNGERIAVLVEDTRQEPVHASTDDERPFVLHIQPRQYAKVGVSPVQHDPHCGDTGRVVDVRIRRKQRDWRKRSRSRGAARSSHGRLDGGGLYGPVNGYPRERSSQRMAATACCMQF